MRIRVCLAFVVAVLAAAVFAPPAPAAQVPPLWQSTWMPNGITFVQNARVVAGPGGDLWVAGTGMTSRADSDLFLARYRAGGSRRWVKTFDLPRHADQWMTDFAVDRWGNAVLAGHIGTASGRMRSYLLKTSPTGVVRWVRTSPGSSDVNRNFMDVAIDAGGNIYLAGMAGATAGAEDWALLKYSPGGRKLWGRYRDGAGSMDSASALTIGARGRLFATGWLFTPSRASEVYTARYTSAGRRVWGRVWDAGLAAGDHDRGLAIAANGSGAVVAGYSCGADRLERGLLLRYDLEGAKTLEWLPGILAVPNLELRRVAISGELIVAAGTGLTAVGSEQTFCAVAYGGVAEGGRAYASTTWGPRNGGSGVALTSSGQAYLTGTSGPAAATLTAHTLAWRPADRSVPWYDEQTAPPGGATGEGLCLTSTGVYVVGTHDGACTLMKYAR